MSPPLRATFRNWDVLTFPLGSVGDGSSVPDGVLGADVLRGYSVELRLAGPCPADAARALRLDDALASPGA